MIDKLIVYIDAKIEYEFIQRAGVEYFSGNVWKQGEAQIKSEEKLKEALEDLKTTTETTGDTLDRASQLIEQLSGSLAPLVEKLKNSN